MLYFFLDGIVFKILSSNASHPCLLSFVHPFSAGENQYFQLFLSFLNWKYYNVIELDLLNTICKSLLHWSPVWFLYAPMFDVLKWCVPTFGWEQPIVTLPKIVWEILKKPCTVYHCFPVAKKLQSPMFAPISQTRTKGKWSCLDWSICRSNAKKPSDILLVGGLNPSEKMKVGWLCLIYMEK